MPARILPSRNAFTLIELLVVIGIIAVLAGLLFPAVGSVIENAKKVQAKNDATQIATAISAYEVEYGRMPDVGSPEDANDDALMKLLMGKPNADADNPRKIVFLEVPKAKNDKYNGVVDGNGAYLDSWGQKYVIVIDDDYDNEVSVPGDDELRKKVAVYSKGNPKKVKEGDYKKYIKSWE